MKPSRNIWLTIPAGFLLGLSVMFAVSTSFDAWDHWAYSWPLLVFLIIGVVWWTQKWARRGEVTEQQASLVGEGFSRFAYALVVVVAVVALFLG
jgi:SNF family Na+-dependent transporter